MSWFRSAVSRAVEAGGTSNLTRTVRSYADSVVQQAGYAVVEGAKVLQDRIVARNFQSFKLAVKRLEEVSVSCRGIERVQLLRRWLVALKEIERISGDSIESSRKLSEQLLMSNETKNSLRKPTLVLYYDPDLGGEPMNFHYLFLSSQALEGMTMSMILEAPNQEEISLLLEIFGLCLTGGKEVHHSTLGSVQNLATAFSSYEEEVLVKREELLQYAQGAIAGLKVNADIARIDSEIAEILRSLDGMKFKKPSTEVSDKLSEETAVSPIEELKEALENVQLYSRLDALLVKKKILNNGDSPDIHAQKVDKLKVLSESLANSALKAEKRKSDHRLQKEEALSFRIMKASEVNEIEKDLISEIGTLERQRCELEAALRKVNTSLAAARARLQNAREEREQFDEASNQILFHLKTKEDELSRSITGYKAEADVCSAFVNFLEDTWLFQSEYTEKKEKLVNDQLGRYRDNFVKLAFHLLSDYKDGLQSSIIIFRKLVENLNSSETSELAACTQDENSHPVNPRQKLVEEYLDSEAKFISTFNVVESIKEQFCSQNEEACRHGNQRVKELLDDLQNIKDEFESIGRPTLEIGSPTQKEESGIEESPQRSVSSTPELNKENELEITEKPVLETETSNQGAVTPSEKSSESNYSPAVKQGPDVKPESTVVTRTPSQRLETPLKEISQGSRPPTLKQPADDEVESIDRLKLETATSTPTLALPPKGTSLESSSPILKQTTVRSKSKRDDPSEPSVASRGKASDTKQ